MATSETADEYPADGYGASPGPDYGRRGYVSQIVFAPITTGVSMHIRKFDDSLDMLSIPPSNFLAHALIFCPSYQFKNC